MKLASLDLASFVVVQSLRFNPKRFKSMRERIGLGGREREMPVSARTGAAHGKSIGTEKTASSLPNGPQVGSSARP